MPRQILRLPAKDLKRNQRDYCHQKDATHFIGGREDSNVSDIHMVIVMTRPTRGKEARSYKVESLGRVLMQNAWLRRQNIGFTNIKTRAGLVGTGKYHFMRFIAFAAALGTDALQVCNTQLRSRATEFGGRGNGGRTGDHG